MEWGDLAMTVRQPFAEIDEGCSLVIRTFHEGRPRLLGRGFYIGVGSVLPNHVEDYFYAAARTVQ